MKKIRLLVVDDVALMRDTIKIALERMNENLQIDIAPSASAALQLLEKNGYDVLMTDILMPEMDGLELLEKAKVIDENLQTIIITGHEDIDNAIKAMKLGAAFYVKKPLAMNGLHEFVLKAWEKKILEEKANDSERRLKLALEVTSDGIWELDLENFSLQLNSNAAHMLGYETKELPTNLTDILNNTHANDLIFAKEALKNYLQGQSEMLQLELKLREKSGNYKWVLVRGKIVGTDKHNKPLKMIGTTVDISERMREKEEKRALEEKMLEQSKLATLGEMATGIVHEMRQPITFLQLMVSSLLEELRSGDFDSERASEMFLKADKLLERMAKLSERLKTFARREDMGFDCVDIKEVINNALLLMEKQLKSNQIRLDFDYQANLPYAYGNENQLEQVFINLFQNAIDALETSTHERIIKISAFAEDKNVRIVFKDNGSGMSQEVIDKMLEPFFSTKPAGKGTGLGMSIVNRIINKHNGNLECSSSSGEGTTLRITIPLFTA